MSDKTFADTTAVYHAILNSAKDGLSLLEISRVTGLEPSVINTSLDHLEATNSIVKLWVDGSHPRRRLYHIPHREKIKFQPK